jgi:hypothetical protein
MCYGGSHQSDLTAAPGGEAGGGQGEGNALCDMGLKHALETFSMSRLRLSGIFYLNRS